MAHPFEHLRAQVRAAQRDRGEGPALRAEGLAQRGESEARDVAAARVRDQHDVALRPAQDCPRCTAGAPRQPGGRCSGRCPGRYRARSARWRVRPASAGLATGCAALGGGGGTSDKAAVSNAAAVAASDSSRASGPAAAGGRLGACAGRRRGGLSSLDGLGDRARLGVERPLVAAARGAQTAVDHDHLGLHASGAGGLARDAAGRAKGRAPEPRASRGQRARRRASRPAARAHHASSAFRRAAKVGSRSRCDGAPRRPRRSRHHCMRRVLPALGRASARARSAAPARRPASRRRDAPRSTTSGWASAIGIGAVERVAAAAA